MTVQFEKLMDVFQEALDKSCPEDRLAFIQAACGEDADLQLQVCRLLRAHADDTSLFDQPPVAAPDLPVDGAGEGPGTQVGPYKLLEQIGEGGMGVVYMAEQREPIRRKVALKIVKPGMDSQQVLARFEAELQALALMDHPHIAKVHDAGCTESGRPYFVMELVRGIPITEYCDRHRLNSQERLELFKKVCSAIQHAHLKGVIHRDVKPNNILVEEHDVAAVPKVIDFGIAKAVNCELTERTLFTKFGQLIGTPLYMSPEQARLNGQDLDTRTDIYSLGVLLYELLTGSPPFDGQQLRAAGHDEMRRLIREEEPPRPSEKVSTLRGADLATVAESRRSDSKQFGKSLRGDLDWVVMKALEKDRAKRYETAAEFAADVQRFLADEPVAACPPSTTYRVRKFAKRNKALVAGLASCCVILLLGIGVLAMSNWITRGERREARRQAEIARAANNFVNVDLLGAADPHAEPDRDLKVRDVLDRAALAAANRFPDQPLVEASVRMTIGEAYDALGEHDEAVKHLRRAFELRSRWLGAAHADTLRTANAVAWVYHNQRDYDRSRQGFMQTLQKAEGVLSEGHEVTVYAKLSLADLERHAGNLLESEKLGEQAFESGRRELGPKHPLTIRSAGVLAATLLDRGQPDDAINMYYAVLKERQREFGTEHPATLSTMHSLAVAHSRNGDHPQAEAIFRETSRITKRVLGPDHPKTLELTRNLATTIHQQGKYTEAEALLIELVDRSRLLHGKEDQRTLAMLDVLASTLRKQGRHAEAADLVQETLRVRRNALGPGHSMTLRTMHDLGLTYQNQQRFAEAGEVFAELREIQIRLYGEQHADTLHSLEHLDAIARAETSDEQEANVAVRAAITLPEVKP